MASDKQAVLLIHGIGFQRPMATLRGFVERVWSEDKSLRWDNTPDSAWSKPDNVSRSFELRRLTTARNKQGVRTDFFEFYWAHLMRGTTIGEVGQWLRALLFRRPQRVPRLLRLPYFVLWITSLLAVAALINFALPVEHRFWPLPPLVSAICAVILIPALAWVLREVIGDAAVYLDPAPHNIQRRHEIRSAGVELLKALHERGYVRIIVVGHSLGSVIGYDILKYYWAEIHDRFRPTNPQSHAALLELELATEVLVTAASDKNGRFVAAQRAYLAELQANGHPWLVSDFITLGSPLTHAELLLARGLEDLRRQQLDRELPTCPPVLERSVNHSDPPRFWFSKKIRLGANETECRVPHHAALFAATVWTNIFFPVKAHVAGDFIGGPLREQLGPGIQDVAVNTRIWCGLFSHIHYWSRAHRADTHISALRRALTLGHDDRTSGVPGPRNGIQDSF
jgi:hypothetical protein